MVVYSRWDPSSGTYDYFEAAGRPGLNDDLPVPRMPTPTEIGVPSVECGRPMPPGAAHVGTGELPQGFIAPPAGVDLLAQDGSIRQAAGDLWPVALGALVGFVLGWSLKGRA